MSRSIYSTKHDVIKMLTKLIFVYKRAMSHRSMYFAIGKALSLLKFCLSDNAMTHHVSKKCAY